MIAEDGLYRLHIPKFTFEYGEEELQLLDEYFINRNGYTFHENLELAEAGPGQVINVLLGEIIGMPKEEKEIICKNTECPYYKAGEGCPAAQGCGGRID